MPIESKVSRRSRPQGFAPRGAHELAALGLAGLRCGVLPELAGKLPVSSEIDTMTTASIVWPTTGTAVSLRLQRDPRYGQLHLAAVCNEDGFEEPFGTISVIPHDGVSMFLAYEDDTFYVKDYAENEGITQTLVDAGLVVRTGESVQPRGSFAGFELLRLTEQGRALAPELFEP